MRHLENTRNWTFRGIYSKIEPYKPERKYNMEAFDVRRPAIPEPKPEQTIRAQPFYGGFIGKEVNDFFAELCRNYPGAEIINVVAAGPERNVLVIYRVPFVPPTTNSIK